MRLRGVGFTLFVCVVAAGELIAGQNTNSALRHLVAFASCAVV